MFCLRLFPAWPIRSHYFPYVGQQKSCVHQFGQQKLSKKKVGQLCMSHEQFLLANLVAQLCWPTFVGRVTSALGFLPDYTSFVMGK